MKQIDAIVIGGGILGCFAARNLRAFTISTLLLEREDDVCRGITRANSAIVYPGCDNKVGSRKAEFTVRGNAGFGEQCEVLEVPFSRCGSLLVTYDTAAVPRLEKKLQQGIRNGVPGLRLLSGAEAEAMEPMLRPGVAAALYAPTTGTVNPWQLGIAAYENALQNGAEARMNTEVLGIRKSGDGYLVETNGETYLCKTVINCAGLYADKVQELLCPTNVRLKLDGAEYMVMDPSIRKPERVIFLQAAQCGKGITTIPCTEGNLLISGVRKSLGIPFATTPQGLQELQSAARELLPELDTGAVIRSFGAVRPNPSTKTGDNIPDFSIENPAPGFYSLIGIKTPGLTCANELGIYLARQVAAWLGAEPNLQFDPRRRAIPRDEGQIICQCGQVTRNQILEAIARGATTVDGVKRRVGSGMGRCQGSRCSFAIEKILEECQNGAL